MEKPIVGTPSQRKVRGKGAQKNPKATFQRAMTDASALNIRNRDHPLNRWVTEMIEMLDLSLLKSLVGDQLNGRLDEATADKLFGDHLKPQERAKAYAFASSLGSLPPGLIADRSIIEPAHALRIKPWSTVTLAAEIVARLDRHRSQKPWDLAEWPGFTFEGFNVGPRGGPRQKEIANHAAELLGLHRDHPSIFDDVMAGRHLRAFSSACAGKTSGMSTATRDHIIQCIATQFAVCAIEHSQRAHGWMISVRRSCVPAPLQHEVTAAGSFQLGGVKEIDRTLGRLAAKYLRRYDAALPSTQKRDVRGGKGNIDLMLREIVEERFSEIASEERELWHRLITSLVATVRRVMPTRRGAYDQLASQLDVMTHWFGSTERELLLCIDLRVAQARSIARSIIAKPELACSPNLETQLYPPIMPNDKMGLGAAARKICLEMIRFAQIAPSKIDESGDDPEGNSKPVDRAYTLLAAFENRRRTKGVAATRAEQFFDAFDPLRTPPSSQSYTYRPGGPEF